ncbi:hypothetical protein BJV78DRAFT_1378612 [Lactifluus subvellereus]|nr:hypothetical protein BJV78DRAFT_1378612 [Lactifluus subvellereus]
MRILPFISRLAVTLLPFLLPAPSTAQNSPLTNSLPLEVRTPYFNFWTPVPVSDTALGQVQYITQAFPGRTALVRIDGVTHSIFGQLAYATQTSVIGRNVTPTRTVFTFQIGPIALTATFFSPIEPGNWVRQSTPFTYLAFELNATDGNTHDVQLYVHAVPENFLLADAGQPITWSTVSTGLSVYEMVQLQNQRVFSENANGQAEWGQYYLATAMSDVVTYGVGPAGTLVNTFATQGSLNTVPASSLEGTSDLSTALALSRNLGNVTTKATAVFAFGFVQDPAVQYVDPIGQSHRRVPYFKTRYSSIGDLIDAFIGDFMGASSRGLELENQIAIDSAEFPDDYYATLLSMATRSVYASTVLTVEESSEGVLDPTDVMMFMKNIGAAVSANRVNPAEVLYAAFPMFMYFDADLGGPLLEPLLRYQSSGYYLQSYAGLDAGTSYPNTSFTSAVHLQGVEQTANMLIMMYAYVQASGNSTLIKTYHPLLKRWTDYLISTTLFTTNQVSGDLLNINNQTNLAIKGIIAIKAMSFMCEIVGESTNYSVSVCPPTQLRLSFTAIHVLAQYGNVSSWSSGYNMFADIWLQTNVISEDVRFTRPLLVEECSDTVADIHSARQIPADREHHPNASHRRNRYTVGQPSPRHVTFGTNYSPLIHRMYALIPYSFRFEHVRRWFCRYEIAKTHTVGNGVASDI